MTDLHLHLARSGGGHLEGVVTWTDGGRSTAFSITLELLRALEDLADADRYSGASPSPLDNA